MRTRHSQGRISAIHDRESLVAWFNGAKHMSGVRLEEPRDNQRRLLCQQIAWPRFSSSEVRHVKPEGRRGCHRCGRDSLNWQLTRRRLPTNALGGVLAGGAGAVFTHARGAGVGAVLALAGGVNTRRATAIGA